jgi:hypothetical protein
MRSGAIIHKQCRAELAKAREAIQEAGMRVPKRLLAMSSTPNLFFVEGTGIEGDYVEADCAYSAKASFLFHLARRASGACVPQ